MVPKLSSGELSFPLPTPISLRLGFAETGGRVGFWETGGGSGFVIGVDSGGGGGVEGGGGSAELSTGETELGMPSSPTLVGGDEGVTITVRGGGPDGGVGR